MIQSLIQKGWGTTGGFFLACALIFTGQRIFTASASISMAFNGLGLSVLLIALILRSKAAFSGTALSFADKRLLVFQAMGSLSLLPFSAQNEGFKSFLPGSEHSSDESTPLMMLVCGALWLMASIPMLSLEWVSAPMRRIGICGERRVHQALRGGVSLSAALAFLLVFNILATRHDHSRDLAYFRSAEPGSATLQFLETLEAPIQVYLYYPRANALSEQLKTYFKGLQNNSKKIKVERIDRLMNPELAKKHDVGRDGTVVISHGLRHDTWIVGEKLKDARKTLAKLDGEFLKRATQLTRPGRVAYLTVGHGELSDPRSGIPGSGKPDKLVREILGWKGYEIKTLGITDGLGVQIPEDASVVLMLGPKTLIFPEEQAALSRYLEQGGKLILALNPEAEEAPARLLNALSLRFNSEILTHDRIYLRRQHNESDRQLLMTDAFANHPSTQTVGQHGSKLSLIFDRAGHLSKSGDANSKQQLDFIVRTIAGTWADKNQNRAFDSKQEERRVYNLAAAVELHKKPANESEEGRALVFADADLFSFALLRNKGNIFVLGDGLSFLEGEEALVGGVGDDEDVPVRHTQENDALLFHGTVFFTPLMVLFFGLGWLNLRRRRRR